MTFGTARPIIPVQSANARAKCWLHAFEAYGPPEDAMSRWLKYTICLLVMLLCVGCRSGIDAELIEAAKKGEAETVQEGKNGSCHL